MKTLRGYFWFIRRYGIARLIAYEQARRHGLTIDYGKAFTIEELAQLEEHVLDPPWRQS